jgi:hypothetical protein
MGPYLPLLSIEVEHGYFDDGRWHGLRFVPTPRCRALIDRAGLLVRQSLNGIQLHSDKSREEALALFLEESGGQLVFEYRVHVDDGNYLSYCEEFVSATGAIPYFDGRRGTREAGRIRLHRAKKVSEKDLELLDSDALAGLLDSRDLRLRPAFALRVAYPRRSSVAASGPERYFLRFGARHAYWSYYVLGLAASRPLSIVDPESGIAFRDLGTVLLSDSRPALAFRSEVPMPLSQRPANRLQLREAATGNGKVLIRRLPVAAAGQISRQEIGGKLASVSEVYVNL